MLQEYDFVIVHRPGTLNANADALSRMPLLSTQDTTGARLDHDIQVQSAILRRDPNYRTFHTQALEPGPADVLGSFFFV